MDWPTAAYYRELSQAFPGAKFVLTACSPESWAASFGETINTLVSSKDQPPSEND